MNRSGVAFLKITLIGFGLIIGFILLELASKMILKTTRLDQKVRYAQERLKDKASTIGCFDAYLGWGYTPNTRQEQHTSDFDADYFINSKGIRDKEISRDGFSKEFRIVALGESTVFGEGVNYGKRFTEIIEDALENVEVINMGVRGFGADQSLLQLERDGFQFQPNAVILFIIQDFFERCKLYQRLQAVKPRFVLNESKDTIVLQDINFIIGAFPETSMRESEGVFKKLTLGFLERSSLFTFLKIKKIMYEINKNITDNDRSRWQNIYKQLTEDNKRGVAYNDKDFERLIFLMLKRYQKVCQENSADFILAYIDMDKRYFLKYFLNPCNELKIKYLDLSDMLVKASNKYSLRFNIDPHYNEFTHRVIGEYVSGYLTKKYKLAANKVFIYKWLGYFN